MIAHSLSFWVIIHLVVGLVWIETSVGKSTVEEDVNQKIAEKVTPSFEIATERSRSGIPDITVHFPDGVSEKMVLERYGRDTSFSFIGHLEDSKDLVAATGRFENPGDKMDITLLSERTPGQFMYSVDMAGEVEVVDSPFKGGATTKVVYPNSRQDGTWYKQDTYDENGDWTESVMLNSEYETAASTATHNFPAEMKLKIQVGTTPNMNSVIESSHYDGFQQFIDEIMAHVSTFYSHSSLGTKIVFEMLDDILYKNEDWDAEDDIQKASDATDAQANWQADLVAWWVFDECGTFTSHSCSGTIGIAWVGGVCVGSGRTSISELQAEYHTYKDGDFFVWEIKVPYSAIIFAHELGHNLGMSHDFDVKHGGKGGKCDGLGIMSYNLPAPYESYGWSTCSVDDLSFYYEQRKNIENCYEVTRW